MLHVYGDFAENFMAMPVIKGVKSANERFAGAEDTYCIEAMMQDGKALQAGTSHFLGQNFAKAFNVTYLDKNNKQEHVWATSWGVSTRLIGALIMTHSDDEGLVLPPKLAPIQVVIVPIAKNEEQLAAVRERMQPLMTALKAKGIRLKFDDADNRTPGWKFAEYEMKGVPVRIAVGPRDLENNTVELARRDLRTKEVKAMDGLEAVIEQLLEEIQVNLFQRSLAMRETMITAVESYADFKKVLAEKGGFIAAHWDGTSESEEAIKAETKATIRCIPLDQVAEEGACIYSGKPSKGRVLFAMAY